MILKKKPLTIAEVSEYMKNVERNEIVLDYLKKFEKVSNERVEKMRESILALNNPKIKEDNIVKVIDFLPSDQEEVNKIFLENSLNEEEARTLLDIVKGY